MIKVTMNDRGRVKAIDKDAQPTWIEANTVGNKPPPVPNWMLPVIINYKKESPIDNNIEVIPCSGQYWNELKAPQQAKILELVEWLGGSADEYVRDFEKMFPNSPRGK